MKDQEVQQHKPTWLRSMEAVDIVRYLCDDIRKVLLILKGEMTPVREAMET